MGEKEKLFVAVLGGEESGKSSTWEELLEVRKGFKTGSKELMLDDYLFTDIYVFNGSPQERGWTRTDFEAVFIKVKKYNIILCSLQLHEDIDTISAREILEFVKDKGYDIFVQWLNPEYTHGEDTTPDVEKKIIELMGIESVVGITKVDAENVSAKERAEKLRKVILGWINSR